MSIRHLQDCDLEEIRSWWTDTNKLALLLSSHQVNTVMIRAELIDPDRLRAFPHGYLFRFEPQGWILRNTSHDETCEISDQIKLIEFTGYWVRATLTCWHSTGKKSQESAGERKIKRKNHPEDDPHESSDSQDHQTSSNEAINDEE
jgi:hypothetical protein